MIHCLQFPQYLSVKVIEMYSSIIRGFFSIFFFDYGKKQLLVWYGLGMDKLAQKPMCGCVRV